MKRIRRRRRRPDPLRGWIISIVEIAARIERFVTRPRHATALPGYIR